MKRRLPRTVDGGPKMGGIETALNVLLVVLLAATLLHAVRLQRLLGQLRGERPALDAAAAGFDEGARLAEHGLGRLRDAAEQLGGRLGHASALRDDLELLSTRGEQLADRLDALVRAARVHGAGGAGGASGGVGGAGSGLVGLGQDGPGPHEGPRPEPEAEASAWAGSALAAMARAATGRPGQRLPDAERAGGAAAVRDEAPAWSDVAATVRSQAERELLMALRRGR